MHTHAAPNEVNVQGACEIAPIRRTCDVYRLVDGDARLCASLNEG